MADRPSEFDLIAELFAPLATAPGAAGLRDDVALVPPRAGCELAVTTDTLVEGVHFLPDDPPETIAKKALRVNLSDLAAKGADPAGYFLALSLPQRVQYDWLRAFARGLDADGAAFSVPLLGGDTTSTPGPLCITVTAMGYADPARMPRRSGARPGDYVYVSGTIGDAGAGLALLTPEERGGAASAGLAVAMEDARSYLISRYRVPTPRLALGRSLWGVATASLDVSDGLIADLGHIAEVSGVRIVLQAQAIPLSDALVALWGKTEAAILRAATAGDDYEIAFTAPVLSDAVARQMGVCCIGQAEAMQGGLGGVVLLGSGGEITVSRAGYRHF